MKLCLFQGTFNPIHNAHIQIAEFAVKNSICDRIVFIPAYNPPHKESDDRIRYNRLEMVKLATACNPHFSVSDIEFRRKGKSYTYLTIRDIYKEHSIEGKIKFLIGTDAFEKIESWYETDKLKELVDFIVFIRENEFDPKRFDYLHQKGYCFEFMQLKFLDISSTEIREKIKRAESITGLVPQKVEEYIKKYELYKS